VIVISGLFSVVQFGIDFLAKRKGLEKKSGIIPLGQSTTSMKGSTLPGRTTMMNYKTLVAASLMSTVFASHALAQCAECSVYQNQDPFTQGLATTPESRTGEPNGAIRRHTVNNAHAEMRGHYLLRADRDRPKK
jgi:hypothetical protein